ncbi:uracil-xanthine permease [Campylobacter sp. TTU-622]|uniref:uracil-xanthine permease family protein n=1 Tax=unclassified Campylobacter TaxID=2593542 RepID=UPI001906B934|nr:MULTISPECIES: uracil-xanthine permease family protein [unclassified Campylobacter]MBK1972324.1 uracil-xanthine permease [Campylobacter sp. TTU_617]MBK1973003.1 uracil-xanthine permease [Campylobacter sp. TTU-622]
MKNRTDLIYELEDRPPFFKACFAALVHLMAMFVAVITPALLICKGLGIDEENTARIICMSLFASGIASLLQIKTWGPIGSGLLSIQGTSFNFVSPIILGGLTLKNNGLSQEAMLGAIFGTLMLCSTTEMIISQFLPFIRKIISPLVSGIVVMIIGLSLINVGLVSAGGGFSAKASGEFGSFKNLLLAGIVIISIIILNRFNNAIIRISSLFISIIIGLLVAMNFENFHFNFNNNLPILFFPSPMHYGLSIDYNLILPLILIFIVTSLETIGDISATSEVSNQPVKGELYTKRLKGGVLANGLNSFISAFFNTFPNSCFGQNNGVIVLTGVASRYVGFIVSFMLIILGLFPIVANITLQIPEPILGGATLIMFGTIAATGVRIISKENLNRRSIMIIAISLGIGLGVANNPDILQFAPIWLKTLFSSGIVAGGISAIVLNIIFPFEEKQRKIK